MEYVQIYEPRGTRGGGSIDFLFESNQNGCVIITVPHACCETHAETMADELRSFFFQHKVEVYGIFYADAPRSEIDMNRKASITSSYRQSVIYAIQLKKKYNDVVWVIDVHSISTANIAKIATDARAKCLIFDTWDNGKETDYVRDLVEYLNRPYTRVRVQAIKGAEPSAEDTNDIMDSSRFFGASSFSIAVEEGLDIVDYVALSNEIADFVRMKS